MNQLPASIIITIAALTLFFVFITVLKYAVEDNFTRARLVMTSFFFFIVTTLTVSYWEFFFATLPYTIPAGLVGVLIGHIIGVRAAEKRINTKGLRYYMEHFAHIHLEEFNWWSLINFYSVMSALALINLVGLTTVIFHNLKPMTLATSSFGAFLIGTVVPYLIHLWSIRPAHSTTNTTSET